MVDLTKADWMPLDHDWDTGVIQFALTTPDDYGHHQDQVRKKVIANTVETIDVHYDDLPELPFNPTLYIHHLGYGGSTLLSRLLDVKGKMLSNIEVILHCRGRGEYPEFNNLAPLFSRSFTNEINVLKTIPLEIKYTESYLQRNEHNVCILFHQTLDEFIVSCFNSGSDRTRKAVLNLCSYMSIDLIDHTNQEQAVKLFIDYWISQMSKYKALINTDNLKVIGLSSNEFFDDPVGYASLMSNYMGVYWSHRDKEIGYRKLDVHSKWGNTFNDADRLAQKKEALSIAQPYLIKYKDIIEEANNTYRFPDDMVMRLDS